MGLRKKIKKFFYTRKFSKKNYLANINNKNILITGANSGATYSIDTIGFTNDFFVQEQFEDNTNFMLEGNSFIDFTDTDPFSEGDL